MQGPKESKRGSPCSHLGSSSVASLNSGSEHLCFAALMASLQILSSDNPAGTITRSSRSSWPGSSTNVTAATILPLCGNRLYVRTSAVTLDVILYLCGVPKNTLNQYSSQSRSFAEPNKRDESLGEGPWHDTLSDDEVLADLRRWNRGESLGPEISFVR